MIVVPARAVPADPTASCNGAICTWSFEVSDEPYIWQAPPEAAQVWLEVQGASGPGGEPLHWKGELLNPQWRLQIEHLPNGLVAMRGFPPGPGEFVYAAPSGWNQSWVNDQAFARVDLIPAVDDADGIARITTISSPTITEFNLTTGSGEVSANGSIAFSEPVAGLEASDFTIWSSGHGCRFENIQPVTASSFTFEMRGCAITQAVVNLSPMSVIGTLPGPQSWFFGPSVALNVAQVAAVEAVPAPVVTPSPVATPSASPTPAPVARQDPVSVAEVVVPAVEPVVPETVPVAPAVEPVATVGAEPAVEAVTQAELVAEAAPAIAPKPESVLAPEQLEPTAAEVAQNLPHENTTSSAMSENSAASGSVESASVATGAVTPAAKVATAAGIAAALATACWLALKLVRKLRVNPTSRPQIRLRALGAS
jgi:hypothetical protein